MTEKHRISRARMGRPSADESLKLRDSLLNGARGIMARVGSHSLSIDSLAREIGVTKRTIYRHFGSKAGLIAAVVDREITRLDIQVGHIESDSPDPLLELRTLARHHLGMMCDREFLQIADFLTFECRTDAALAERIDSWHAEALRPLRLSIRRCQESGLLLNCELEQITLLLVDLLSGAADRLRFNISAKDAFGGLDIDTFFTARWRMFMRLTQPDPWANLPDAHLEKNAFNQTLPET